MTHEPRTFAHFDEESRTQFWATLALRHVQGLGPRTWTRLLRFFGSAHSVLEKISRWSEAGVGVDKGAQVEAGSWRVTAQVEWDAVRKLPVHIILWHDPLYPRLLKRLPDAPPLLYCKGDLSLLTSPALAIVGARHCTREGVRVADGVAERLAANGITVISGMAQGIDRVAHGAALRGVGRSIGVLGTGIDIHYPPHNADLFARMAEEGLLVTEFAPGTHPMSTHFPIRNRIISGLSLGVLVVEAALRSGSLITARLALEQNRDVFAIPGPAGVEASLGCQELIRQGARPVFNAEDILQDMASQLEEFTFTGSEKPQQRHISPLRETPSRAHNTVQNPVEIILDDDQTRVFHVIKDNPACHVDIVCAISGMPAFRINGILTNLEVDGLVKRLPGARYMVSSELQSRGFIITGERDIGDPS